MVIKQSIFKAYDIRGVVQTDLTDEVVVAIGQAIGTQSIAQGERNIVIARDGRLSGGQLRDQLIIGLKKTGCHVMDIGMTTTPTLYFATKTTAATSGVMITGSHNPPEYNGFKIIIAGKTLSGNDITMLYDIIAGQTYDTGAGSSSQIDIKDNYLNAIVNDIKIDKPLKIVVDCGNGVAGDIAPELYQKLGVEVVPLFCEVDGNFPNHHPNPSDEKNLLNLQHAVKFNQADVGLAFDGDGDRLGLIDNQGNIIWADRQMILYAQDILTRHQGAKIIYDVKCSNLLPKVINKLGGQAIMCRTGHSFIKAKMQVENALLAGEMSGHIFFKERWYGFDDALYTGARLLEILSKTTQTCAQIFQSLPNSINTPEINIAFDSPGKQFEAMDKLLVCLGKQNFDAKITDIDGIRADFPYGWGLVRPSNTMPCLVLRFEADSQTNLENIQTQFKQWLSKAGIDNTVF